MENHSTSSGYSGLAGLIVIILIGWWLYNTLKPVEWRAFYETSSSIASMSGGKFDSKDACRAWIEGQRLRPGNRYNFECGSNCEPPKTPSGSYVCDDTFD